MCRTSPPNRSTNCGNSVKKTESTADDEAMPDSVKIVGLTPDQWETYRDIRLRGLLEAPQAFARSYEEELAFPQERWLERARNPYNFLAIEDGVPLGTMGAFVQEESGVQIAHIVGVFVAEKARRQGIGSKLLRAVLGKIKQDSSIKTVRLTVNRDQIPAIKLYEKFGFHITGEETQKMGDGNEHTEYLMELVL
jgi:ribosomal protein S18 acetylase RimI-like enzyme